MIADVAATGQRVLELGCGQNRHPQATVAVDARPGPGVDFTCDLAQPLPIKDEDFDVAYSAYVAEHLSYLQLPAFLKEVRRILRPGGRAVLVVPNTEAQLRWVLDHPQGWDGKPLYLAASEKLFGDQAHGAREGLENPAIDSHKVYLNPDVATTLMREAGFVDVLVRPFGARSTDMIIEAIRPYTEKTYTNAMGPGSHKTGSNGLRDGRGNPPIPAPESPPEPAQGPGNEIPGVLLTPTNVLTPEERAGFYGLDYWDTYQGRGFYLDYPTNQLVFQHVMARKPESVLELGCGRGYVLKRLQDAGVWAKGFDVSRHAYMTRVCEGAELWDLCKTPWKGGAEHWQSPPPHGGAVWGDRSVDLCFSHNFLNHLPPEALPGVFAEMKRTCRRGLHSIDFNASVKDDPSRLCQRSREWWQGQFQQHGLAGHELFDKVELERGEFPHAYVQGDGKVKVNVGCAQVQFHHGWVNVDVTDLGQWAQMNGFKYLRHDASKGMPFGTGTVDCLFSSHFLEHLSPREGLAFLRECRRMAKPTAVMRLLVPDTGLLTSLYCSDTERGGDWGGSTENRSLADFDHVNHGCRGVPTAAGKLWALAGEGHHAFYDWETLELALKESGWVPARAKFRQTTLGGPGGQVLRETLDTLGGCLSLIVEAVPAVG